MSLQCPLAPLLGAWEENEDIIDRLVERELLSWIKLAGLSSPSLNLYSTTAQTGPLSLLSGARSPQNLWEATFTQEIVLVLRTTQAITCVTGLYSTGGPYSGIPG